MTGYLLAQIEEFVDQGGFVMPPLVLAAMLLWYAIGYRLISIRRGVSDSARVLLSRFSKTNIDRFRPRGIIDDAVMRGVVIARQGVDDLRRSLDVAFYEYEKEIGKYRSLVSGIVVAAPLLGLLGTVSGMVETFDSLAEMALFSQTGGIAGGISEALFSTQMGLAVAIPGMIVGRMLARRQAKITLELTQIKNMLCAEFGSPRRATV